MNENNELIAQIKRLNQQLEELMNKNKFMIYSGRPGKFIIYNFIAGVFRSLGSLIGTAIVAGVTIYFFSQINLEKIVSGFLQQTIRQINLEQMIPPPSEQPLRRFPGK